MNAEEREALRAEIDRRRRARVGKVNPRATTTAPTLVALPTSRPLTERQKRMVVARELRAKGWTASRIGALLGVPESTIRNWCLGGVCACGVPLEGSKARKQKLCQACAAVRSGAARQVWTLDLVVARIREWADLYGEPPSCPDWGAFLARSRLHDEERARRYENAKGYWPHFKTVVERFGTWNAAIEAAGFEPRAPHGGAGNQERRRSMRTKAAA